MIPCDEILLVLVSVSVAVMWRCEVQWRERTQSKVGCKAEGTGKHRGGKETWSRKGLMLFSVLCDTHNSCVSVSQPLAYRPHRESVVIVLSSGRRWVRQVNGMSQWWKPQAQKSCSLHPRCELTEQQVMLVVKKHHEHIQRSLSISEWFRVELGRREIWNLDSKSAIWMFFSSFFKFKK